MIDALHGIMHIKSVGKKKIKKMKIYYVNIRGLKSKFESLKEIIEQKLLDTVGIVEICLQEDEEIQLEGYHIGRRDRSGEGGGLLLGVRSFYQCIEEDMEITKSKYLEGLCILIGSNTNVRVSIFMHLRVKRLTKGK